MPDVFGGPEPVGTGQLAPDLTSVLFEMDASGPMYEMGADGEARQVAPEDDLMPADASPAHGANLAEQVDERELDKIAQDLLERIDEDIETRRPWADRFRRGMEMMGLIEDEVDDGPFPGSATVVMPVLSEATVQFWARALAEQVPSEGPVKSKVMGKSNQQLVAKANRVAAFMNHEIMFLDRSWYADHSRMLFALPYSGTCFKKSYRDFDLGRNVSCYVPAEDFICNNSFTDLDSAPRYTHRIWRTKNEVRRAQVNRYYRDVDLMSDQLSDEDLSEASEIKIEVADGDASATSGDDTRHELFEVYCELDLTGFEDVDGLGQPTGIALPYIVTIDKHSEKVLAIYRGWKEADPLKRRRQFFTKYDYVPGMGFYSLGLLHLIGGLQQAATGALRAIIDGAATASLQGGFMTKDASIRDRDLTVEPGVWKQVDATLDDLSKAFFTPPFKEPSPVLFQVMGLLVERAEKFAATTELMTGGQDSKNAPVGSTMALLEQGGKVFSAIHRGLHKALADELRQRFELIQEYMPVEGYPYDVEGAHEGIMSEDFAPGVSVIPVSDPNVFSQAQRVALNQAVYELATANPDVIKRPVAIRRVLEGLKVPDYEELLISNDPPPPMDPVSEIQSLLRGEPVQAYPDQDHQAYIAHYMAFLNNPQFGGNAEVQKQIGPSALALLGQRLAYAWATHARALGAPVNLLPPPMAPEGGEGQGQQQVPPEMIAQIAAQIAPQMAQVPGLPAPENQAEQAKNEAEAMQAQAKAEESRAKAAATQQTAEMKAQEGMQKLEQARRNDETKRMVAEMQVSAKLESDALKAEITRQAAEIRAQGEVLAQVSRERQAEDDRQMKRAKAAQDMAHKERQAAQDGAIAAAKAESDIRTKEKAARGRKTKGGGDA